MNPSKIASAFVEIGRCVDCPVVDMHAHYGPFRGIYMPRNTAEEMMVTAERCGVEAMVSSGHLALVDMVLGNAEMAEVTERYPGRWYGYCVFNPNYPREAQRELALFDERRTFVGLKFHPSSHEYPLTGERYEPALTFAAERELLVLTHTWGHSRYDNPKHLAQVAERYPEVTFLAGHTGYGEFDACLRVASEHDNVYLELTAAYAVAGLVEEMVRTVGADKVVLGYDLPWFDPYYAIGCVVMAHVDDAARRAILYENGRRLLERRCRV
ncbi:MAG: amidohydrolase family protein [Anaerolineae bacterium]|nr:amidohydrolase family protein [Anaerolineae bacterium]